MLKFGGCRACVLRAVALIAGVVAIAIYPRIGVCGCPGGGKSDPIKIIPNLPLDINAPCATLPQAANFAWQEFISLNWPAAAKWSNNKRRDVSDTSQPFGDPQYEDPLVWHTFRGKVEIFPNATPAGYGKGPSADYGYDERPVYNYTDVKVTPPAGNNPAPWINLDENSQIGLDKIYAGVVSSVPGDVKAEILFMAKANRNEYVYIASNQWWKPPRALFDRTASFVSVNKRDPKAGSNNCDGNLPKGNCVSLPNDSIEVKAAWRRLTPDEMKSGRFYTTRVRYYTNYNNDKTVNAVDDVMGLVGLHIIRKTPSAPYFIYATFEQADNITDSSGKAIEDEDGNYKSVLKNVAPMTPNVVSENAGPGRPQQFETPDSYPAGPNKQLYYRNIDSEKSGLLHGGIIVVNKRINDISPEIIEANKNAHDSIRSYAAGNNFKSMPVWLYYKLVSVQSAPLGRKISGVDDFPRSVYYQANSVIETDYNLQKFSGQFDDFGKGVYTISDLNSKGGDLNNVAHNGGAVNMGGCMGCHGNGQANGSGFSFIFLDAPVKAPEWDSKPLEDDAFRRFVKYLRRP